MRERRLRVIWVCGAAGAGKSVATWSLFGQLAGAGQRVAYVDIDQLGMLYPDADDDDPDRHRLKCDALRAVAPRYAAAGAQILIVSGVVDVDVGPAKTLASEVDLTMFLLTPDSRVLRERILARGWAEEDAEEAVAEDRLLRGASFMDAEIDTAGLSVADTVARVRESINEGGRAPEETHHPAIRSSAEIDVLVVTGPRAVGSSTIGFGLAMHRWRAGLTTGFVDVQQLAFMSGRDGRISTDTSLGIDQVATMHQLMAERGAERLVVSGHLGVTDRARARGAFPAARVTFVRLRADSRTLEDHVRTRVTGSDARLAGDDLVDASRDHQAFVVANALAEQDLFDADAEDDVVLDVSGRTPAEVIADLQVSLAPTSSRFRPRTPRHRR